MPPHVAGATFSGSESCEECHQKITQDFHTATHALMRAPGINATEVGCESCHGPGSLHKESGGAHHTIVNGQFVVRNGDLVSPKVDEMLATHRTVSRRFQPIS